MLSSDCLLLGGAVAQLAESWQTLPAPVTSNPLIYQLDPEGGFTLTGGVDPNRMPLQWSFD